MTDLHSICVYCGSSPGDDPAFTANAYRLGETIADAGLRLVYGGGTKGLMGAVAQGVMDRGGSVFQAGHRCSGRCLTRQEQSGRTFPKSGTRHENETRCRLQRAWPPPRKNGMKLHL